MCPSGFPWKLRKQVAIAIDHLPVYMPPFYHLFFFLCNSTCAYTVFTTRPVGEGGEPFLRHRGKTFDLEYTLRLLNNSLVFPSFAIGPKEEKLARCELANLVSENGFLLVL
jgi:hypothetical protein